ncbi:hypothetical protein [Streptomyces sp. NPDC055749]
MDDGYEAPGGHNYDWPSGHEMLLRSIAKLFAEYPHLANELGYSWARGRSAYRTAIDVNYQYHVLELLADVDPGHPNLIGTKPVAARGAVNRDFISYAQPGGDLDFIFISRGFMDVVTYFLEMTADIVDLSPTGESRSSMWGSVNLAHARRKNPDGVGEAVGRFVDQSIKVCRCEPPARQSPITLRLLNAAPDLMWTTYDAIGSFVVAHELAHLLERHDVRDTSLAKEISADRAALSLQIARSGTQKRMDGSATVAALGVNLGGPAFYLLGSLYYLITALAHWTRNEPTGHFFETIAHLKVRWTFYLKDLTAQGSPPKMIYEFGKGVYRMAALCAEALHAYSLLFSMQATGKPKPFVEKDFFEKVWDDWSDASGSRRSATEKRSGPRRSRKSPKRRKRR